MSEKAGSLGASSPSAFAGSCGFAGRGPMRLRHGLLAPGATPEVRGTAAERALVAAAWRDARAALERLERDGLLAWPRPASAG